VFGGFTTANWNSPSGSAGDLKAFLFSLRRNGTQEARVFKNGGSQDKSSSYNIITSAINGPSFGYLAYDLKIVSYSNKYAGSSSFLGYSYELPSECSYMNVQNTDCSKSFLAGSYTGWLTTEIEVYQMIYPINK
jgi:hypothetical protein